MNEKYNVYLVSDSTGETLDRIFLSLKSQFANFDYEKKFKFNENNENIKKISKLIELIFKNYKKEIKLYKRYQKKTLLERQNFKKQLSEIFIKS